MLYICPLFGNGVQVGTVLIYLEHKEEKRDREGNIGTAV